MASAPALKVCLQEYNLVCSADLLQYYIRHTIDARRATPRNSDADPIQLQKQLVAQHHLTDYTITTVKSYFDSEAGDPTAMNASRLFREQDTRKSSKETVIEISGWQDEVVGWQKGRSLSRQEDELLQAGIISSQQSEFFDRERRCWITNDPRPVHYPWEDFGPGDFLAAGALKASP